VSLIVILIILSLMFGRFQIGTKVGGVGSRAAAYRRRHSWGPVSLIRLAAAVSVVIAGQPAPFAVHLLPQFCNPFAGGDHRPQRPGAAQVDHGAEPLRGGQRLGPDRADSLELA
jgi:hypothetical protein